jgi:hypothetical protein
MLCVQDSVRRVLRHTSRSPAPSRVCHNRIRRSEQREDGCPHPTAIGPQIPLPRIALGICHSADHRDHSHWNEQTTLCSVTLEGETLESGNAFVRKLLRHTCSHIGDLKHSGSTLIENKSIRSQQWLFLMDHSAKL